MTETYFQDNWDLALFGSLTLWDSYPRHNNRYEYADSKRAFCAKKIAEKLALERHMYFWNPDNSTICIIREKKRSTSLLINPGQWIIICCTFVTIAAVLPGPRLGFHNITQVNMGLGHEMGLVLACIGDRFKWLNLAKTSVNINRYLVSFLLIDGSEGRLSPRAPNTLMS